jgi:hypothetical protein
MPADIAAAKVPIRKEGTAKTASRRHVDADNSISCPCPDQVTAAIRHKDLYMFEEQQTQSPI